MNITKFGHSCLLVEESGVRILTDPGDYSTAQNAAASVDIILITHEHQDHLSLESLQAIITQNPEAKIFTNRGAAKILDSAGIPYTLLEHGGRIVIRDVPIEAHGERHAIIYPSVPPVPNTGYFIAERFFYPGDALHTPERRVEILALPIAGPWTKLSESIDYAKAVKPKHCFPVHDGMLKFLGSTHRLPGQALPPLGISWRATGEGQALAF